MVLRRARKYDPSRPVLISIALAMMFISAPTATSLPEGNSGIAARYPGDSGIASDSAVVFADDFESYSGTSGLTNKWTNIFQVSNLRIATEPGNFFSGGKAIEMTVPQVSTEVANGLQKTISPERDLLFLRFYAKWNTAYNVIGSAHNGGIISSHYCCPGVRADGFNKFLVSYEAWRDDASQPNPGKLEVYVYHPEQRDRFGDLFFPTGTVFPNSSLPFNFGPDFVARPDVIPALGQWFCYELMVKANTPGQRDGRIAFWVDGRLAADFGNLRLRDTTALGIDHIEIDLHVGSNTQSVARKWYDNVVAATSYIGPMVNGSVGAPPSAPRNLRIQ
jgi:hypothetical protein